METKLVVNGNTQGVRLPKAVVDACGIALEQPLTIEIREQSIVLSPVRTARAGWAEAARDSQGEREALWGDMPPGNAIDDDWTW